ncbi:energy-coupling factor transporter transmembrane component T family protein [Rhodococcus zopfii]|uniref:energy-coupling factor transporter transmembrane component T family protein n=1 Tax=Rhodococcus zopfii TaxID=43772 RepID=UPI0011114DDC|nr:energy-coupling factor transporter transmembrane protein EcfT [Rhodococcus zopfii]
MRRARSRTTTRAPRRPLILLRPVPRETPVHRLWAGTKLLAATALAVTAAFVPTWRSLLVLGVVLATTIVVARIPRGAVPTVPWWVFASVGFFAALNSFGGGLDPYVRSVLVGLALLIVASLVGWTTRLSDIVDALPVLFAPLRLLRCPVDEWVTTCTLALRVLPSIREELRMVFAARALRGRPGAPTPRGLWHQVVDAVGAVVSVSLRQVRDLGDALAVRGQRTVVRTRPRWGTGDLVTVLVVASACTVMAVWG